MEWVALAAVVAVFVTGFALGHAVASFRGADPEGANGNYVRVRRCGGRVWVPADGKITLPRGGSGTAPPSMAGVQKMRREIESAITAAKRGSA